MHRMQELMTIVTVYAQQGKLRLTFHPPRQAAVQPNPPLTAQLTKTKDLLDQLLFNVRRLETLLEQLRPDGPTNQD